MTKSKNITKSKLLRWKTQWIITIGVQEKATTTIKMENMNIVIRSTRKNDNDDNRNRKEDDDSDQDEKTMTMLKSTKKGHDDD